MMRRSILVSFLDQGLASAVSLAMTVGLVAVSDAATFGVYVFIVTLALVAASLQYGLVGTPTLVEIRPLGREARAEGLATLFAFDGYFRLASSLLVGALALAVTRDAHLIAAAVAYAYLYLARETARSAFFAEGDAMGALRMGLLNAAVFAVLFAVLLRLDPTPFAPLAAAAVAQLVSLAVFARRVLVPRVGPAAAVTRYRQRFPLTGWSLITSAANEAQTRGHVFVVQALRGVDQLGVLEAGRVLFAPLFLFSSAWQRAVQPELAALLSDGQTASARRVTLIGILVVAAVAAAYCAALWLAWDVVSHRLYGDRFGDLDVYVAGWAVYSVILLANWTMLGLLTSMRAFRRGAMVTIVAATANAALLLLLAVAVPLWTALAVMIAVQTGVLVWLVAAIWGGRLAPPVDTGDSVAAPEAAR